MKADLKETYEELIGDILSRKMIRPEEIPNIDVYMDQLTTFMDERLRSYTRNPSHDKVLTKTMINNYTKNDLLPPPRKKKYSRDHLILLFYIFYLKKNFSIEDIDMLISPLKDLRTDEDAPSLTEVYRESLLSFEEGKDAIREELDRLFEKSENTFAHIREPYRSRLRNFAFLMNLAHEVQIRQVLVEKLLDYFREEA